MMEQLVAELPQTTRSRHTNARRRLTRPAIPIWRCPISTALELGLHSDRRRQAVIQLASSLRNIGQAAESVALLSAERELESDDLDDAVSAFLALALVDTGREREAVSLA
jgi:hypothetical protein